MSGREFAYGVLAAWLSVSFASSALLFNSRFFFTDDYATQFMPGFREIDRLLSNGEFPLLTDRLFHGGAILQEYTYGLLNPISLMLFRIIGQFESMAVGAAVYSLFHIGVLAGGVYFLSRVLGCARRHALLVGVLAPLSDWIFFWGATDWIPALVSTAWMAWACGFFVLTFTRRRFAPIAAMTVALTLLSGWPFTDLALLLVALVTARVLLASDLRQQLPSAIWVALSFLGGALLAAPALIPLEIYSGSVARPAVDMGWAADLTGLLEFGMPFVHTRWGSFTGVLQPVSQPIVYAAWFAPLVLATANWRRLIDDRRVWIVGGSVIAFAALSMISHIGALRWMFRLLPYYQIALLVLVAIALTEADRRSEQWDFNRMALVIVAEVWLAFGQTRSLAFEYLAVAYGLGLLAWLSTRFKSKRGRAWTIFALSSSIGVFWLTVWTATGGGYPQFPQEWRPPTTFKASSGRGSNNPTRFGIAHPLLQPTDPGATFWRNFGDGNTRLEQPGANVIGSTSLISPEHAALMCLGQAPAECDGVVERATKLAPPTGKSLLDLMSVDQVAIERPSDAREFARRVEADWSERGGPGGEFLFDRIRPIGLISYASSGVLATVISHRADRIEIRSNNTAGAVGMIVLARAWYPGWSAKLSGKPVSTHPLGGWLVSIDLPAHSDGILKVQFWPAGLTAGLLLAALGACLMGLTFFHPKLLEWPVRRLLNLTPTSPLSLATNPE